ncbi:MAG: hypothetical protein ICV73_26835, partial [Acetobacteraceae bacterium]|nr:hypothetical protein [Acetobacteraceae bacterium]
MDGFNPDALVDDAAVRRLFAGLWNGSPRDKEAGAWLIWVVAPTPGWTLVKWPPGKDLEVSTPRCLPSAKAMVHTHPVDFTTKHPAQGPQPSTWGGSTGKGDWGAAVQCRVPNYVLSANAIWKVLP